MASVSVVFRTDAKNNKGECPINFFVIKDRKLSKVATGILLEEKFWDAKNKRVKSNHPNSKKMNSLISNKFAALQDQVLENETISKSLTARQLKENLFGQKPVDIFLFSKEVIKDYMRDNKIGTHDRAKAIMNKLKTYLIEKQKVETMFFQEMTPDFLSKYEKYLKNEKKNKINSIHGNLKFFRKLFNDAIREDKVDAKHNPFTKYKLKTEKTERTYLSEDELEQFSKVKCTPGTRLELHRDMFIFSAYTGGLRVSDLLQLKWKNLDKTHIHFTIKKTGSQISIKVPDVAMALMMKYKTTTTEYDDYVFPMLQNGLDEDNFILMDNEISKATAYINKNLKLLAKSAKLNKSISFHISRHTFATRALKKGMRIEYVSKLMGHAAIKETQVYAKIINQELDKAMDVFNN